MTAYDFKTLHFANSGDEVHVKAGTSEIEDGSITYDKLADSLVSAYANVTGYELIPYQYFKRYVDLSGDTANVATPATTSNPVDLCIAECSEGDVITVTAYGQNATRPWAFVDGSGNILQKADQSTSYVNHTMTAPEYSAYFVSNNFRRNGDPPASAVRGRPVDGRLLRLEDDVSDLLPSSLVYDATIYDGDDESYQGYISYDDGAVVSSESYRCTDYINVKGAVNVLVMTPVIGMNNQAHAGIGFYDSNKLFVSSIQYAKKAGTSTETRELAISDIPTNAVYMRTAYRSSDSEGFYVKSTFGFSSAYRAMQEDMQEIRDALNLPSQYGLQMFEKVGVIGDSISVGWGFDKNGGRSRRNVGISWPQQMARRLGCTMYNLGASGVDPVEWFQPNYEFAEYCYTQYQSVGFCDLYIVGLGLNQASLGTIDDIDSSDYTQNASTFYGQYARIIQMINDDHPDAIVMCLTEPTTRINDYDQAVRDICALSFINAQLIDLETDYIDLFVNDKIIAERQSDGLHYTPYGYSLIADGMVVAMNDYISKHTAAFKYVGIATV